NQLSKYSIVYLLEELLSFPTRRSSDLTELLAILIAAGNRDKSAMELGREILSMVNSDLVALSRLSLADLCKIKGIGKVKAITIIDRKSTRLNSSHVKKSYAVFCLNKIT